MARKIKLTDARIGKLKAGDVEYMVWDTRIAGFGIQGCSTLITSCDS